jgi:TrpR-related protein YerC/YecD
MQTGYGAQVHFATWILTNVIARYYIGSMKRRALQPDAAPVDPLDALCDALLSLQQRSEMRALLRDLCTPAELEAMSDRWRVVPLLLQGLPYREIHDRTAVSVTTIGRVARCLVQGAGGYRLAAEHLHLPGHADPHQGAC